MNWSHILNEVGAALIRDGALMVLLSLPFAAVGWLLHRRKSRLETEANEPFTDLLLRPPGESLRLKVIELSDKFDEQLATAAVAMAIVISLALFRVEDTLPHRGVYFGISCVASLAIAVFFGRSLIRLQKQLWDYRLGFDGERVVGETLNQLLANGFKVFHDLPFAGFNIDHVIVGPAGVYAVETKTRRKPTHLKGHAKATVVYDGHALHFPWGSDTHGLAQAERNAATLAKWLTSATGEHVTVKPILTLPGWWVEQKIRGAVNVLNPKQVSRSFPAVEKPLSPEQIQRIVHQLSERCRIKPKD